MAMPIRLANEPPRDQRCIARAAAVHMLEDGLRSRALCLARLHDASATLATRQTPEDSIRGQTLAIRVRAAVAGIEQIKARLRRTCPACLLSAEWSREAAGCAEHRDLLRDARVAVASAPLG